MLDEYLDMLEKAGSEKLATDSMIENLNMEAEK
jgi:hypothetical protein